MPKLAPAPDSAPERLETGTLNHEGIVGAAAAVEFLASLASGVSRRERLAHAFAALHASWAGAARAALVGAGRDSRACGVYGPPPGRPRTPTIGFTVAGRTTDEVATALAGEGVFVSNGDFYATTAVERLGLAAHGLVRAGCACYTTSEEVDRLVAGVRRSPAELRQDGCTGILTRVFSHSRTRVAPLPSPSLRMVNVSTGCSTCSAFTLARPTSRARTAGV